MVRFTPNGWSVISRQRLISLARSSGVGWVRPVKMPSAPALETAEASSARPTHCMPPCTIGCLTPNISVKRVLIIVRFPADLLCPSISEERPGALAPRNGLPLSGLVGVDPVDHILSRRRLLVQEIRESSDEIDVIDPGIELQVDRRAGLPPRRGKMLAVTRIDDRVGRAVDQQRRWKRRLREGDRLDGTIVGTAEDVDQLARGEW